MEPISQNGLSRWWQNLRDTLRGKRVSQILSIAILVAAVPATVFIAEQQQQTKSKADSNYCAAAGYHACTPGTPTGGTCQQNGQTCHQFEHYACNYGGTNYCDNNPTCGAPCQSNVNFCVQAGYKPCQVGVPDGQCQQNGQTCTKFTVYRCNYNGQNYCDQNDSCAAPCTAPTATPTPIPPPTATPIPTQQPNCSFGVFCSGCQAHANSCGTNNGDGTSCIYTQPSGCRQVSAPNQPNSCTGGNTCQSGFTCNGNSCVQSATPTSTPTPIPGATATPTPIPGASPTPTSPPGSTSFAFAAGLIGIGSQGSNQSPVHRTRNATLCLYSTSTDPSGDGNCSRATYKLTGTAVFGSGTFSGSVSSTGISSGQYAVLLKIDNFLRRRLGSVAQTISAGSSNNVGSINVLPGDINNDNVVNILDYNAFINCYGSKFNTSSCTANPSTNGSGADLNDDGKVDGVDYNLFVRSLANQLGD